MGRCTIERTPKYLKHINLIFNSLLLTGECPRVFPKFQICFLNDKNDFFSLGEIRRLYLDTLGAARITDILAGQCSRPGVAIEHTIHTTVHTAYITYIRTYISTVLHA